MYLDVYERDTSRYDQDTCKIHRNTSGYVSDRKPPPKRIGNPTSPQEGHQEEDESPDGFPDGDGNGGAEKTGAWPQRDKLDLVRLDAARQIQTGWVPSGFTFHEKLSGCSAGNRRPANRGRVSSGKRSWSATRPRSPNTGT